MTDIATNAMMTGMSHAQATALGTSQPTDHWAVTVYRNGEEVVTISSSSLSGREISQQDEDAIRICALTT